MTASSCPAFTQIDVFAAPPLQRTAANPVLLAQVTAALGLTSSQILAAQTLDNGPHWLALLLDSPETVLQLTPDHFSCTSSAMPAAKSGWAANW